MKKTSKIFIAGISNFYGQSLLKILHKQKYTKITNVKIKVDLYNYNDVYNHFLKYKPEYIFILSGDTGGIKKNIEKPASLLIDNLTQSLNVFRVAKIFKSKKLLFLGSSCVYPKFSQQPMLPSYIMKGYLEPTNSSYALSQIAGIELSKAISKELNLNFISAIPANPYGPYDSFSRNDSHVIPALINKFHNAKINNFKEIKLWGSGKPRREFIFIDDLSSALILLMKKYNDCQPINIGTGEICSIKNLAYKIKEIIKYSGKIYFDNKAIDGILNKTLNSNKIRKLGWSSQINIDRGIKYTYKWYKKNY